MTLVPKKRGISLTEMLVVVGVMAILLAIALPAAKSLTQSLEKSTGVRSMVNAALANARAIAIREQKYAGVRFQQDLDGKQYLVLIWQKSSYANGYSAVPGRKPMPFPEDTTLFAGGIEYTDAGLSTDLGIAGVSAFTILFNPSGKLVLREARMTSTGNGDAVFNTPDAVKSGRALFVQDTLDETSVSSMILINPKELAKVPSDKRFSKYLIKCTVDYVNPYTGELIKKG